MSDMKVLGFTGTRKIAGFEGDLLAYLRKAEMDKYLTAYDGYVTGGCKGWDGMIGRYLARTYPDVPQWVLVPWKKDQVDAWWEEPEFAELVDNGLIQVMYMEEGTDYRYRNEQIVDAATKVFYCAERPEDHPSQKRSGTWMTKRIAQRYRVPAEGIILKQGEK